MRLVKAFVVGATALFVVITLLSLLIPSRARVSRTVLIDAPASILHAQISELKNWKHWHPLLLSDSATVEYGSTTCGVGASCAIRYKNKVTQLQITHADAQSIEFDLTAEGEDRISNQLYVSTVPEGSQVRVDWNATTHLRWYPWDKFYAIFINQITGPGYEAALNGLKQFAEKR